MNIKTIDINVLTWFDSVNGNSYFAGEIILNYKLADDTILYMPYQYGYGSQFKFEALRMIHKHYATVNRYPLRAPYRTLNVNALWQLEKYLGCIVRINTRRAKKAELRKVGK